MLGAARKKFVAIGEAMVELAPVEGGLYRQGFAGDTFNTAWHAAQLLGPDWATGFLTRVGSDRLSGRFLQELERDGLDTSAVAIDPERGMGLYMIELQGVERSFYYWRQVSAARHLADDPAPLLAAVDGAALIHLSGITLAILSETARKTLYQVLRTARKQGAKIAFDPNFRPKLWNSLEDARSSVADMLALTDIALPSFDDEALLWGDASPTETLGRLQGYGVPEILVKDGGGPLAFYAKGARGCQATPPVGALRDTTGAGDAFNAGYLAARLQGAPVQEAISDGQTLAALVLATPGARAERAAVRGLMRSVSAPWPEG